MKLSESVSGKQWLSQFQAGDAEIATMLLDELLLVGRDSFVRGLHGALDQIASNNSSRPMALFAEREVARHEGDIEPFFPTSGQGRAIGAGVPPIIAADETTEIGSEGSIANLITNYARSHAGRAFPHPGPDTMRKARVGPIVVVTDFIGSGKRICDMLDAFSKVATLQSWRSFHLVQFHVVAYSGTGTGISKVKANSLKPRVHIVVGCPTVWDAFGKGGGKAAQDLCRRFPPNHKRPFGFQFTGALIAFPHGMPNNCPPIFWDSRKGWQSLFPRRGTAKAEYHFPSSVDEALPDRARKLLAIVKTRRKLTNESGELWIRSMLVLKAIELNARTPTAISAQTRLSVTDVTTILGWVQIAGWTTEKHRLTNLGKLELKRLRRRRRASPVLPTDEFPFYYPTQLRAR